MRILFLTTAHNSLSQRLWTELGELGHEIRVCERTQENSAEARVQLH